MRIGHGYDVHRLVAGRALILGGVNIAYEKGLDGHSDADVLTHAVMDALLGAAALGDIGRHFPDTDPAYKGISSMKLLKQRALNIIRNSVLSMKSIAFQTNFPKQTIPLSTIFFRCFLQKILLKKWTPNILPMNFSPMQLLFLILL